tara:strand:+ start:59 stop:820 length:762 start_codon:yes stop_codon:yes gene_type:complete
MATDARAYYDIDTQGFDPNTEQTRAFNQATQRMSNAERQQLSDFFAGQARKEQAKLPQNTRAPSGAKAPAQKARAPMQQGEMAAVENWLRTPEAQTFLVGQGEMAMTGGGAPASPASIGQGEMAMTGGGAPASPRVTGQGEMAMTGGGAPASPPQDTDRFMGENQRDQQMMQQQSQREALINYLMGMQQQNQYRPPMRRPQMMPNQMPYDPGFGVVGGSRVNPNPIGQQGPRPQPRFNAFQVPQNRFGPYGGY